VKQIQIMTVGEALIDFISGAEQASVTYPHRFSMYPGGAAANVAMNSARLGASVSFVGSVGDDSFGVFLYHHLADAGVDTSYMRVIKQAPTTLAVVGRHNPTPDFVIYRGADAQLRQADMPDDILHSIDHLHVSAFALSCEPASSTVLNFLKKAHHAGCRISFDPNYHPRLWHIAADPLTVLKKVCPYAFVAKPSLDDCTRLFGSGQTPEAYASHFLALGVRHVVLTMGANGALLADQQGTTYFPTNKIEIADVTGAGDSFWSGMLVALLDGYTLPNAVRVGQAVAAIKLQHVGPLSTNIDRFALYQSLDLPVVPLHDL
jgi:fructokinase